MCLGLSTAAMAGGRNAADYPLRVHIFQYNAHSHYYRTGSMGPSSLDEVDGEGRANLYENGAPRGFDFSYRCSDRLRGSPGYETFPARWKKQDREIEVLLPEFGKPGEMESCGLKVLMKETAYYRHDGGLDEVPIAKFKDWMDKHQYDPEKGKNLPVAATPSGSGTQQPAPAVITVPQPSAPVQVPPN